MISKPAKWLIWIGIGLALLVAAVAVGATVILPGYVQGRLIPRLSAEFGLRPADIQVRRIGLWGSDLGPIRLLADDAQVIGIAAVQIDYTPLSLLRGEIKGLSIGGLGIRIKVSSDGTSIAGVRIPTTSATSENGVADLDLSSLLPIELGRLDIVQSFLILELQDRRYRIPFDLELETGALGSGRLKGRMDAEIIGNPLTFIGSVDQRTDLALLELKAAGFRLDGLGTFLPGPQPVQLTGLMDIDGTASFGLRDFDLRGLALNGRLNDTYLNTPHGSLYPATGPDGRFQTTVLSIAGERLTELKWRFSPFQISGPAKVFVEGLSGTFTRSQDRWAIDGSMKSLVPAQLLADRYRIPEPVPLNWQMSARHNEIEKQTEFEVTRHGGGPLAVSAGDQKLTLRNLAVRFSGILKNEMLDARGDISAKGVHVSTPDGKLRLSELRAAGTIGYPLAENDVPASVKGKAEMPGIDAKLGSASARLPKVTLHLNGRRFPQKHWDWDGRLTLANGRITDPSHKARVRNLSVELPLKWPAVKTVPPGRVSASTIQWSGRDVGGIKGTLRQENLGLTMALTHASKLFPGMRVLINGGIDRTGSATIDVKVPRHLLVEAIDLGRFQPTAAGMMLSGQIEAVANVVLEKGRLTGDARFQFDQGRLHQPSQNLLLEGVDMQFHIDDMNEIQSAPQQKLTVEQLSLGSLKAQNLSVDFQLEHPNTLFVEKAQLEWSEGKINTAAIRIVPGVDEYDVILFCDRLNLAMVLEQLGAAQAKGDGSVNGRIPIHWANGRLSFDNGFLFSSPGQTGSIQLTGTEVLLSGLPPGTPQHAQLDIATEALKDYTYKWAKLMVQTEDDILLLKLQFDGKPNRLLPFAYDQQLAQFKRVAGEGQADFKGISIDLNLRSPLNEILNYKELLK